MRAIILVGLLAVVSGNASADWVKLGADLVGGFDIYVDPTTATRAKDIAHVWTLSDFKTEQSRSSGFRYLSAKSKYDFDCKLGRSRVTSQVTYSGNMASGISVDAGIASREWKPVMPGGVEDTSMKLACGRV